MVETRTQFAARGVTGETREEAIARWESVGWLVPDCRGCEDVYKDPRWPWEVMNPSHNASPRCESGGHPHCTCDVCW